MTDTKTQSLHGHIVSFKTRNCGVVTTERMRECLQAAGFPKDTAADIDNRSAFKRAIRELKKGGVIATAHDEDDFVTMQINRRDVNGGNVEYPYEAQVTLNLKTGAIFCTDDKSLEDNTREEFSKKLVERTRRDILTVVQRILRDKDSKLPGMYCVNEESGGAYFVPIEHDDFVRRIGLFLKEMGGKLVQFPVPKGDVDGDACVREAVTRGFEELLAEMDQAVDEFDVSTRPSTMQKMQERYSAVQFKLSAYVDYLGDKMKEAEDGVKERKAKLKSKIKKLMEAKEEAKEEAKAAEKILIRSTVDGTIQEVTRKDYHDYWKGVKDKGQKLWKSVPKKEVDDAKAALAKLKKRDADAIEEIASDDEPFIP